MLSGSGTDEGSLFAALADSGPSPGVWQSRSLAFTMVRQNYKIAQLR